MRTIMTILLFMLTMSLSYEKELKTRPKDVEMLSLDTLQEIVVYPVNYDSLVLKTLWKNGVSIDLSYIILAQAKHECANFESTIFIEGNNIFGMKCSKKRKTTCIGINRGHGIYASIEDCVIDYVYYMKNRNIPFHETSVKRYVNLLKRKGYFEDNLETYYKSVKKHRKQLDS